jgi:hypothetical protein
MSATTADMRVDGNAIGGLLLEIFGVELTASFATCAACGTRGELARTVVYVQAAGVVARCPACEAVLLTVVEGSGRRWVSLRGLRTLELPVG